MKKPTDRERGSAMVLILGALAVLAALAVIVVSIASSDKWSQFSEYSHNRAFFSADAASEAGLNWLRLQTSPPAQAADSTVCPMGGLAALGDDQSYRFGVKFKSRAFRPGWGLEYKDYQFSVQADGASAKASEASVDVVAARLYREGY